MDFFNDQFQPKEYPDIVSNTGFNNNYNIEYKDILNYGLFPSNIDNNLKLQSEEEFKLISNNMNNLVNKEYNKKIKHTIKKINKTKNTSVDVNEKKTSNRCYTCKPRGKVLQYIIGNSFCGNFVFHHDLSKRPIILLTPVKHYTSILEIDNNTLRDLFSSIEVFCGFWNIKDYQVSYNEGAWKTGSHFHIKIKIAEDLANKMRSEHFQKIKLEKIYKEKFNLN